MSFREPVREYLARPHVRPWALAVPVLVLLLALPLLRPLRHPDPTEVSDDEAGRLATIAAVAERGSLSVDNVDLGPSAPPQVHGLVRYHGRTFSDRPPVMAFLLAGPYWVMYKLRLTLAGSPVLAPYLLTLLGVTLPVAGSAGLVYKMGRVFELRRPLRAGLAAAVVFGSGMFSYAVVLTPHAPAAALVLGAAGCLVAMAASRSPGRNVGWLAGAGLCAGLAAALDPPAAVFPIPLVAVILSMRWPLARRAMGVALFALGALQPLSLHLILNHRITGDWKPGFLHPELAVARPLALPRGRGRTLMPAAQVPDTPDDDPDDDPAPTGWRAVFRVAGRVVGCLLGGHGLLTHFPVLVIAGMGMAAVLHRHWPAPTKALAMASAVGGALIVVGYAMNTSESHGAMFANRWFVAFVPLALFWSGAWLRRPHRPAAWAAAGALLAFSVTVSLVGATDPLPRAGYDHYTPAAAAQRLWSSPPDPITMDPPRA